MNVLFGENFYWNSFGISWQANAIDIQMNFDSVSVDKKTQTIFYRAYWNGNISMTFPLQEAIAHADRIVGKILKAVMGAEIIDELNNRVGQKIDERTMKVRAE